MNIKQLSIEELKQLSIRELKDYEKELFHQCCSINNKRREIIEEIEGRKKNEK